MNCLTTILILALSLLGGCVLPIPTNFSHAYPTEVLRNLQSGTSTKEEVLEILGEPNVTRFQDSVWVYASFVKAGELWVIFPLHPTGGEDYELKDTDWLILEFNDNILNGYEKGYGNNCTEKGFCIQESGSEFRTHDLYLDTRASHQIARSIAEDGKCRIFLLTKESDDFYTRATFRIGNHTYEILGPEEYLLIGLKPGRHTIELPESIRNSTPKKPLNIDCENGVDFYVTLNPVDTDNGGAVDITFVDAKAWESQVGERRLLAPE